MRMQWRRQGIWRPKKEYWRDKFRGGDVGGNTGFTAARKQGESNSCDFARYGRKIYIYGYVCDCDIVRYVADEGEDVYMEKTDLTDKKIEQLVC